MGIAADIYSEAKSEDKYFDVNYLSGVLSDFILGFDWTNSGPLKGLGGEAGVKEALKILRRLKARSKMKVIKNA